MRIHPINELPRTIILGRQTETGVNEVRLDCAEWLALWPKLSISVWVTPPGGDVAYPAATHMEGGVLVWTVNDSDTAAAGSGTMEVLGVADGVRKLSAIATTRVLATTTITQGETPKPLGKKTITLTFDSDGNLTSDTDFETAWAMDAAALQSAIVIAEDGMIVYDENSTERSSVTRVYKATARGARFIEIQYEDGLFDRSDAIYHSLTKYISWVEMSGYSEMRKTGYVRNELPFKDYPSEKAYMYWSGHRWEFATIDQLKADLGLA